MSEKRGYVNNFQGIVEKITEHLRESGIWTSKSKENGKWIDRLKCPVCGKDEAFAYSEAPFAVFCSRLNECGEKTKTLSLFPEIICNFEKDFAPTPEDPHYPATSYLKYRGLAESLENLEYKYWHETRQGCGGAVMFPVDGETWNGRLFNPPKGEGKTHNKGKTGGKIWKHPGKIYDPGKETFITEGIIDALSFWEIGEQAISVLSAGQNPGNFDLSEFRKPVFAFDNNLAGWKALKKWKSVYPDAGAVMTSDRKDWNDLLLFHPEESFMNGNRGEFEKNCENLDEKISREEKNLRIRQVVERLNKDHAVVMLGGKCLVMNEVIDPAFNRPDVTFSSLSDFSNFYANDTVENASVARYWITSEHRRQYKGLVFSPSDNPEGYYNLWRGFRVEPRPGDWDLFEAHIYHVICSGDKDIFKWVKAWLARIFQNPGGERPGTALVLRGKEGTGKDSFVSQIGELLGVHYLHISNQKQLTGRFNSHLKDALLVFCDEGFWAGDKSGAGVLKSMITDPYIMVEPKGKDAFQIKNHVSLIMASNENWVVPAGLEARRFAVLDVSETFRKNHLYFKQIFDQMNNGGREAMLYDLLKLDISDVNLRDAPKTEALFEQKISSMNTVQKFWYSRLYEGKEELWGLWIASADIYRGITKPTARISDKRLTV